MLFVTLIKFTPQGIANISGTTARAKDFIARTEATGVKVRELLWTQGGYDGVILFEAPDVETASATTLKLAADGNVETRTLVAFDAAGMDQILAKTGN
jgi:uncharacterized protein with GYD domain